MSDCKQQGALLLYPPVTKGCEPPAGITRLHGALRAHAINCTSVDLNIEAQLYLLRQPHSAADTWSRRALKHVDANITALRSTATYASPDRHRRAVADLNRVLHLHAGNDTTLSLGNYQDNHCSAHHSAELLMAAQQPQRNIFYPFFARRLEQLLADTNPAYVGISINFINQACCAFAIIGFIRRHAPHIHIGVGGGLVTSWLRSGQWHHQFDGLIDSASAGAGEQELLRFFGVTSSQIHYQPDYSTMPVNDYLAPGFILPYSASSGCYWNRCDFCPERAEGNRYQCQDTATVINTINTLAGQYQPSLIHLLDNAISPALLRALTATSLAAPYYAFARFEQQLCDDDFCRALRRSGCVMLKLGVESGSQAVLDAMDKGVTVALMEQALAALSNAGIKTYVYLLFGTPTEDEQHARRTMEFVCRNHRAITFINAAIFNLPLANARHSNLTLIPYANSDLSLYCAFHHPKGWQRNHIRHFLNHNFKRHPDIAPIINRDPAVFTSNHAAFFSDL